MASKITLNLDMGRGAQPTEVDAAEAPEPKKPFVAIQFASDTYNVGIGVAAMHPEDQARMLLGYLKSVKSYHLEAIGDGNVWDSAPDARTTAPRLLREIAEYIEKGH